VGRRLASVLATGRERRASRVLLPAALALLLAGCGSGADDRPPPGGIGIAFEDIEAPESFSREGAARVDDDGTPGLWAAVAGLPRPERGRIRRLDAGGEGVVVPLFRAPEDPIRLSVAAGSVLGLAPGATAEVSVVALRREPRIIEP
jgi:hypothetical protein